MRTNRRDALTAALRTTNYPGLSLKDNYPGVVARFEACVAERALEALGYQHFIAEPTARMFEGCARVRLNFALKHLRYTGD